MAKKLAVTLKSRQWAFVDDPVLRDILHRDYEELRKLVRYGADKSTVVLSGTIVEALLAGILSKDITAAEQALQVVTHSSQTKPFSKWTLWDLTRAATHLGILDGTSEIQASALKDFRNFIHPLVEEREAIILNQGTVTTSLILLNGVLDIVEKRRNQEVFNRIEKWAADRRLEPNWSGTHAYMPILYVDGEDVSPIDLKHNRIRIRFGRLKHSATPFGKRAKREELRQRLNKLGLHLPAAAIDAFPAISLEQLTPAHTLDAFVGVLNWMADTAQGK